MPCPRNIVLVGPTGAGKSSIGRLLAQAMDWQFVDLDREIEQRVGTDIRTIFDEKDEPYFRAQESAALQSALENTHHVIATGAGCVLSAENRQAMREHAFVVHLAIEVGQQLQRLHRDTQRPLLQRPDREQVLQEMAALRGPLYAQVADLTFTNGSGRSPKGSCAQLLTQLKQAWHDA